MWRCSNHPDWSFFVVHHICCSRIDVFQCTSEQIMHICVGKMRNLSGNEVFDAFSLYNPGFGLLGRLPFFQLNSNSEAKAMTKRIATRCGALLALVWYGRAVLQALVSMSLRRALKQTVLRFFSLLGFVDQMRNVDFGAREAKWYTLPKNTSAPKSSRKIVFPTLLRAALGWFFGRYFEHLSVHFFHRDRVGWRRTCDYEVCQREKPFPWQPVLIRRDNGYNVTMRMLMARFLSNSISFLQQLRVLQAVSAAKCNCAQVFAERCWSREMFGSQEPHERETASGNGCASDGRGYRLYIFEWNK